MTATIVFVSDVIRRSAENWPDRIAVQNADGSVRLTYAELWREAERGAAVLRSMGLGRGDRVLLAVDPSPAWMVSFLAIAHAGLVCVPIPSTTPSTLVRVVAKHAGIRVGIANRANGWLESAVIGLRFLTPADLAGPEGPAYGSPRRESDAAEDRDAGSVAVLVFTSGSTTRPRAVALSHAALRANLRSLEALRSPEPGETVLSTLPPSHAYELVAGQLAPLAAGARVVYSGAVLPNRLVDTVRTQAVTRMMLVPALMDALAREVIDRLGRIDVIGSDCRGLTARGLADRVRAMSVSERGRLREAIRTEIGGAFVVATLGGAASDPAWIDVLAVAGVALDVGYGLTEAGPIVTMGRAADCPPGSVGRALPGVEIRIAEDGEILVRSQAIMQGYAGDAAATEAALTDGWLRTGDRGRLDAGGFLFIQGRIKEAMVTSAGETIYPDEIEPVYDSQLFAEVAVVPMPDDRGNDVPTLVVVPASALVSSSAPADAIRAEVGRLRAAAPAHLRVRGFVLRSELPRSAAGKIRRRALADELRANEVLT